MKTTHKNTWLLAVATLLALKTSNSFAGDGYISIGGGYGIATASQSLDVSGTSSSAELVKGTFGKGFQAGLVFGTMIRPNIGLELGASYLLGATIKSDYRTSSSYTDISQMSVKMLRLFPSIKIMSGSGRTQLYLKAGMAVGLAGKISASSSYGDFVLDEREEEYTGGIAIGFTGAVGADIPMSANSYFFAELNFIAQSWAPSKGEITAYRVNGVDALSTIPVSERETEYVSSLSNSNSTSQRLKFYVPMSSVGINVGFRFSLSKKAAAAVKAS